MPSLDKTHYVLNSVPTILAEDYLRRADQTDIQLSGEYQTIIVNYFSEDLPNVFQQIRKMFPEHCVTSKNDLGIRNIITANFCQLSDIYQFSLTLDDQLLANQLKDHFTTSKKPVLKVGGQIWNTATPKVMVILNTTPDSFYDGGNHFKQDNYADIAAKMIADGADIIDIGGESTRPGSLPVDSKEEIRRVLPAVEQIRSRFNIPISVDTVKPDVADMMLSKGANLINDVSGLKGGQQMIETIVRHKASYCLMHTLGPSVSMQNNPTYDDVVTEVFRFFAEKIAVCKQFGLSEDYITLDPGIGFGKTIDHNMDLLRFLDAFSSLHCTILLGTSNKSFIGKLLERESQHRLSGTMITQAMGWLKGASIFRVHEIQENYDTLKMTRFYTQQI